MNIPGGMIYVGTSLPTPYGSDDPCLINPSLTVGAYGNYTVNHMGYWPSYSEIDTTARRSYLEWLAGGRKDPQADIGYVFLFFYGLERRAIIDATNDQAARLEWPIIAEEVHRLLDIYGEKSGSFRNYASSFLDWLSLGVFPTKAYLLPVPQFPRTYELPIYIRLALGQAALDTAPISPALAFVWATRDPSISLRTPAVRCAEQFEKLFMREYATAHGEGMVLPRNRTKLKLVYRPASSGFRGYNEPTITFGDTPDVTALTAPIKKLQMVVDAATQELEAFSRYSLKHPDALSSLEGILLLPTVLWPEAAQEGLRTLKSRAIDGTVVAMSFGEVLESLGAPGELNKARCLSLVHALESQQVGLEPDVLAGARAPKQADTVVLFSTTGVEASDRTTASYQAAVLTIQLAAAVAAADGEFGVEEQGHIAAQVRSWSHLSAGQVQRLIAHIALLTKEPVSLAALKKRLAPLAQAAKESIAQFMATVAQSDGTVTPAEVRILEKVYKALGVEPDRVFTDLHAAAADSTTGRSGRAKRREGFRLDPERIAALQRDTAAVSALLSGILEEEVPAIPQPGEDNADIEPEESAAEAVPGILDLDEPHSAFARLLLSRSEWQKDELEDAAADLDLMLSGALETVNEAAFDLHEMPFLEGDDPMTVNPELAEVLAG